jgi:PAS domain S-box-containing protein
MHRHDGMQIERAVAREIQAGLMNKRWDFALLDQTGVLGMALDCSGKIVDWNAGCQRITGYPFKEVQERCFWDFLLPEERGGARETFFQWIEGRGPVEFDTVVVIEGGELRWIAWSGTAFAGLDGRVEHVVCIGVNLTGRRKADREWVLIQEASEARRLLRLEQEEARVSEALVTSIVENLPDVVFVKDANARV